MKKFQNKKIGIWGFGIVGKSALAYFDQSKCQRIQILDNKEISLPSTKTPTSSLLQTPTTIEQFFSENDYILASPGIKLHKYEQYFDKFLTELDILHEHNKSMKIIAITGSIGKTSITHILSEIVKTSFPNSIAAGNIGNAMLSLVHNLVDHAILELSSFQLQYIKKFAPNLAIITNIYPNHLDHHTSMEEYFQAKYNIFTYQNTQQQALLPLNLTEQIQPHAPIKANWSFFTQEKPSEDQIKKYNNHTIYYLEHRCIYKLSSQTTTKIYDLSKVPPVTFDTNWLIIIAACDLYNIHLDTIAMVAEQIQLPDHRLQKITSKNDCDFYNDSKSTVWQATLQATKAINADKPIFLFLGGLSKGADRTPLMQALAEKNITIFAFGQEAQQIADLCKKYNIHHFAHATLDAAWQSCIENITKPTSILFSPGGSSYDLFKDYQDRGKYFTKLVENYTN